MVTAYKLQMQESIKSLFKRQVPNKDDLLTESKQALPLTKQDVNL